MHLCQITLLYVGAQGRPTSLDVPVNMHCQKTNTAGGLSDSESNKTVLALCGPYGRKLCLV